jgi:hypothetical protein
VLASPARARHRPAALVASLGSGEAPKLACCPVQHLLATFPRAAVVAAAGRRRSPSPAASPPQPRQPTAPRWACGRAWPLARPAAPPARQIWPRPRRLPGQGPNCCGSNLIRVFRVKSQGWFVKNPI